MDRREFLRRVLGGAAAAAALPLQPLVEAAKLSPGLQMVPIDSIRIDWGKWLRPKTQCESEMFADLVTSIQRFGVLKPIAIQDNHELIDGVYRIEAARRVGLIEIPAIVHEDLVLVRSHREMFAGLDDAIMETRVTRKRTDG